MRLWNHGFRRKMPNPIDLARAEDRDWLNEMINAIGAMCIVPFSPTVLFRDYGQEISIEMPSGRGCFLRYGSRRASVKQAMKIAQYLARPRDGRQSREEVFQFLGEADV